MVGAALFVRTINVRGKMWQVICSNPQLTSFRSQVVCPRPNTFRQTRKFLHAMLKTSSTCWTLIIRCIRLTIFFKFENKGPMKKPRSLSLCLSLRRRTWRLELTDATGLFEAGINVFEETDCQKQRTATTRQEVMRMLTWLWHCLAKEEVFRDSCTDTCIFGQWNWWSRLPAYISRDSAFPLNYHLLSYHFLCQSLFLCW